MPIFRSDDPIADFHRHDAAQNKLREELPVCDVCDHTIDSDYYHINGDNICADCMETHFKKEVEI